MTKDETIVETKQLRKDLDVILQRIKALKKSQPEFFQDSDSLNDFYRAVSICDTKTTEAIHWLGETLKAIGTDNPYPNSRDTSNTKIDPTADGLKL